MRFFYFLILVVLVISCVKEKIEIKASDNIGIEDTYIRTTRIEINQGKEEQYEVEEPQIDIISPKNGELINDTKIIVRLNISNFKLITPDKYPKKGEGYVQVWVDNIWLRDLKTEFVFENESDGQHTIKAELMLSNNTVLPYSKTVKIYINKTLGANKT